MHLQYCELGQRDFSFYGFFQGDDGVPGLPGNPGEFGQPGGKGDWTFEYQINILLHYE